MLRGKSLYIVIVGCGRLGSFLANRLSHEGHSIVVIDSDESTLGALSAEFSGFRVTGDGTEFAVLKEAKTDRADVVIATTQEDNVNLMVCQVARKVFEVPTVIARVFEPERSDIYQALGVETICPTTIAGEVFLDRLGKLTEAAREGE